MSTATATAYSQPGLLKLTVTQLKGLCKDKKISGYSKLGKQALIQKLIDNGICSGPPTDPLASLRTASKREELSSRGPKNPVAPNSHPSAVSSLSQSQIAAVSPSPSSQTALSGPAKAGTGYFSLEAGSVDATKPTSQPRQRDPSQPNKGRKSTITTTATTLGKRSSLQRGSSGLLIQATPGFNANRDGPCEPIHGSTPFASTASLQSLPLRPSAEAMPPPPTKKARPLPPSKPAPGLVNSLALVQTNSSPLMNLTRHSELRTTTPLQINWNRIAISCALDSQAFSPPSTGTSTPSCVSAGRPVSAHSNRFKPLVVDRSKLVMTSTSPGTSLVTPVHSNPECSLAFLKEFSAPMPALGPITMPPSLAQRKRVHRWAVILSGLTDKERAVCVLVSRAFRYAIYLSASSILKRDYNGRRLRDDVLSDSRYSQSMTNMWPYLRAREAEVAQRQHMYKASFLARFFERCGMSNPIVERLWASSDNPKQIMIAVRFALTRAWFELSVGVALGGADDPDSWLHGMIVDVQEVVKGEIWSVTVDHRATFRKSARREDLYVLEATCEVVGRPTGSDVVAFPVRADWSAYIAARIAPSSSSPSPEAPLLSHLKWACTEDYELGISRLWMKRVSTGDSEGHQKRMVAERYVMACVVGNSGQWMGVHEMDQDFAGLRERVAAPHLARAKIQTVNLYLPEHHHVESVHFASARGEMLHPEVAVVQTPHREYFVLRDNGMQIGCEEEGVARVWQEVLRCNFQGTVIPAAV